MTEHPDYGYDPEPTGNGGLPDFFIYIFVGIAAFIFLGYLINEAESKLRSEIKSQQYKRKLFILVVKKAAWRIGLYILVLFVPWLIIQALLM